jgi:hypothetical protein
MGRNQKFTIDFDKAVDVAMKDAEAIYSLGCDMMFNSIIVGKDAPDTVVSHSGTPVDTGFARASWWKNIGGVGSHPNQPTEGENVSTTLQPLGKLKFTEKAYLANNAPYILALEYGHSAQARNPDGMIRITLAEAPRFWELAKKRLASERGFR